MTAGLTQVTERFKFLVAFRPGLMSPTLAAHMAATYQRSRAAGCSSTWSPAATTWSSSGSATTWARTPGTSAPASSCTSSANCGAATR